MLSQETWHDPYRSPSGLNWWLMPRNPPSDLTQVGAHLRAVWALPDNQHVWVGGDFATLLHSHDEGRIWEQIKLGEMPVPQPAAAPPPNAKKPAPTPNAVPPAISLGKGLELPPAQNPVQQTALNAGVPNAPPPRPAPLPRGVAAPSTVPVGTTVRMQITTLNFRIEKPNASVNSIFIKPGSPELAKDPSVLYVPLTVDPRTPPGPYTIKIYGARLPEGSGYELTVEFTVVASSPKSAAALFWRLPSVYAAEPPISAQGTAPGASIFSVIFSDERSGSIDLGGGGAFGTKDGGGHWNLERGGFQFPRGGGCIGSQVSGSSQCWGQSVGTELAFYLKAPAHSLSSPQTLFRLNLNHVWVGGANGSIQARDGSSNWQERNAPTKARINGLFFQPDGKRGWAVGSTGVILSTADGGQHWSPRTKISDAPYQAPYSAGPAPWYILSLFGTGFLLLIALVPPPTAVVTPAIEVIGASDRPLENDKDPDPLSFGPIARGLAYFIRNRRTNPPLNFAITGPWGGGKTSLMRLLRFELEKHGFRTVWFNAWHHQKEDYLLPSLLETIRQEAVPKLWDPGGIGFRFRLLRARVHGWFMVLAVCFLGAFVFSAASLYKNSANPSGVRFTGDLAGLLKEFGTHGAFLVSAAALLTAIYKWLSAFGVAPAALLSSTSAGARVADLEKQTSFRYRFAKEFREVTMALGPRQMVIFIDDLDRCQPINTLDVLEAVNFLSSSGECFVVMGMAKELVTEYVANSLVGTASALNANSGEPPKSAHDLADEYLQKMINIEVPVPKADPTQLTNLVASLGEPKVANSGTDFVRQGLRAAVALVVPLMIAGVLIVGGFQAGTKTMRWLLEGVKQAETAGVQKPDDTKITTPALSAAATAAQPKSTAPIAVTPAEEGLDTPDFKLPLQSNRWNPNWPALLMLPLLGWVAYRIATWRADLEPDDSDEFTIAMDKALPVILARPRTPRDVKRFVNKVRFIAMRQRQRLADDRTLWEKLWRVPHPQMDTTATGGGIPDGVLVVLAALQYWHSDALDSATKLYEAQHAWPTLQGYASDALETNRARYREYASGLRAN